jgi:5-methylcytosine-specific restriction endonuclease McrA
MRTAREFKPGNCEYCGASFVPMMNPHGGQVFQWLDRNETDDHIYPTFIKAPYPDETNKPINRARCCFKCNHKKGSMHPLMWVVQIWDDKRADAFGGRLLILGESEEKLADAYRRRFRALSRV